ncbi:serine/threonine-protein kinase, partial [bacterium]|nr:serine/threonine-protein kinase [bacterium]
MIGKSISQYRILKKLGEGGMGEVYLAEDTELHRKIALKFLPAQYTRDEELNARFKREARTAAALNHPNIITIHEVGEVDGKTFIAMEYVEGQSLRERMRTEPLATEQILDYCLQICAGLSKAHADGIIHRDLKPENIMVDRDGRLRILDFGLAKFTEGTKLTRHTSTLGSLNYMSPEQFESSDVDHRTDLWSLGVMLYEMLVGHNPFEGEYEAAVMYSIVNESPKPMSSQSKRVPVGMDGVAQRALAKRKENRYASAEQLIEDVKRILGDSASSSAPSLFAAWRLKRLLQRPVFYMTLTVLVAAGLWLSFYDHLFSREPVRIAVLPFEGIGLTEEDSDEVGGLWNQTLDNLNKLKQVRPLTRDIVRRYRTSDYDPVEFKDRYGQDYVLRTQVAKDGDHYRFIAYMTDLNDFAEVWLREFGSELLN